MNVFCSIENCFSASWTGSINCFTLEKWEMFENDDVNCQMLANSHKSKSKQCPPTDLTVTII